MLKNYRNFKMRNKLMIIMGAAMVMLSMTSCNSKYPKGYELSDTGVVYKYYSQSGSDKAANLGDYVRVQMVYSYEDSILFDTRGSKRDFEMKLEEPTFDGDIYAAVAMMSEGDSASFLIDAVNFFTKLAGQPGEPAPAFVKENTNMVFDVKLTKVMSEEEHSTELRERVDKRKADEPIVMAEYIEQNEITAKPTESGLYFINIRDGKGKTPVNGDVVEINFKVMLMDGTVLFDSWQENRPVQFEFGRRFDTKGLVEGISQMRKGQVAHLIVPSSLAFGEFGRQGLIEPYSTLLYDVEILDIKSQDDVKKEKIRQMALNKKQSETFLANNANADGVVVLPSGLQYKVLQSGDGDSPSASSRVRVHYHGTLIDGRTFDSSYERGKPSEFAVNGVIKGWTEALQLMKTGDKWKLFIPSELAYGESPRPGGIIEPNMALIFDVELIEIVD